MALTRNLYEAYRGLYARNLTRQAQCLPFFMGGNMESLKIYEIENAYIDYLVPFAPHLFHNKKENQENERKYIGIILTVNGLDYFAPLSSFKEKHRKMKNNMDFLKVGNGGV